MTLVLVLVLLFWTVASAWFFLYHLGDKYRKATWVDFVLAPPVLVIAHIIRFINSVIFKRDK